MADGGQFGFMQITRVAQSCQFGNQAELAQGPLGTTNQEKTSLYRVLQGSRNFNSTRRQIGYDINETQSNIGTNINIIGVIHRYILKFCDRR